MTATITADRRRLLIGQIRASHVGRLDPEAQLAYVIGLLIRDDRGFIAEDAIRAGVRDPGQRAIAAELLRRARR